MTTELTLHTVSNEARVLDIDLAARLGSDQPLKIRSGIIVRHNMELRGYGELSQVGIDAGKRDLLDLDHLAKDSQSLSRITSKAPAST